MSSDPTDDEVTGPDVNNSLTPDTPEANKVPLLHRRAYLRMGAAAVAAVGGSVAGLAGEAAATKRAGIEFAETVDMVEDAGCDPTGTEPIDDALSTYAGNDTLLEFPVGRYRVESEHSFEGLRNFGILGLGDTRRDVQFVFPTGYSGIFLALWRGRNWLIENVTVQQSSDHETGVGVVLVPYDNLQVQDFEVAGFSPWRSEGGQRAMYLDVLDADGTAVVDGYVRAGPAHMTNSADNYSNGCQALLTDEHHRGTLYLRNCRVENASENAFYCSRGPGAVRIENCYFKNNDNSAVRISSNGSYIRDSTIVIDTENDHPDNNGSYQNPRGLWVEDMADGSTGAVAENCEFVLQSAPKIAGLLHVDASQGRFEVQNCRFYDGDAKDWSHLFVWLASPNSTAPDPADVTFSGCSFVADAAGSRPSIDLRGRSGSTLTNCCLSGTGDGILLKDAADVLIEDTTINVDGTPILYDNATATTIGISESGTCPLPEPLTQDSPSEDTTDTTTATIESDGGGVAEYEFAVSGDLTKGHEADSSDTVDGSTATGWVGPDRGIDDFGFTGEITGFQLDGPATVYVDGEEIDPDDYGQTEPQPSDGELIYIDGEELAAIESKVDAGEEPWASAYQQLIADADAALSASLESVTDNGAPAGGAGDPNKFGTDAPYQGEDGVFSDDINRQDYYKAIRTGDDIRSLGLAYAFTGENRYAEKAIDLIHHWFVDPDTRMYPSALNYGPHTEGLLGQNSIEHYITIPKMLYGAGFVLDHEAWSTKPDGAVADLNEWVRAYLAETEAGGHRGGPEGNGIYKWWLVNRATAAAFIGDMAALERVADDWRTTAFIDYEDRGTFQYARWRTRSLYYSFSALNALVLTAEIARHYGIDLYGHTVSGVNRLKTALDFHAPYMSDPSSWPWEELGGLSDAEQEYGAVSFEIAHSHWQDPDFLTAVNAAGRPVRDQRILGWVTLTHGNRFDL